MPIDNKPNGHSLTIEVLISTYNRVALLERTLKDINEATRPADTALRIMVAVNACNDNTVKILEKYQKNTIENSSITLSWRSIETPGKSHALNEIIPSLSAEIVACVDDDHRIDVDYFCAITSAVRSHPEASMFCGRILPDWTGKEPSWVHDDGPFRIYPLPIPRFDLGDECVLINEGSGTPGGGNLVVRRAVFKRVGQFATDLGPVGHDLGGAEDIDWVKRALAKGESVLYLPEIVQYHFVDSERLRLNYVVRKAYSRTASTMRVNRQIDATQTIPLYMYRKLFGYLLRMVFCLSANKRRYYLVRSAAALGEIRGFQLRKTEIGQGILRG